jgi:hypothetical protein
VTPPESVTVAVELAELRGEIRTGLADIKGSLRVLVERTDRTDQDVRQLRQDTEADIEALREEMRRAIGPLETDVEALKRARWPLPTIGALAGVGGAVAAAVALLQH